MNTILLTMRCVAPLVLLAGASPAELADHHYGLRYDLTLIPAEQRAEVSLTLDGRVKGNIWKLRFHVDPQRHAGFEGDGKIEVDGEYVTWSPPEEGGRFSFHVPVDNKRPNGRYDARMTDDWAIFRGDDLFPPARTDDRDEAEADATLHVHLPEGWTFATAYRRVRNGQYEIEHAHRRFDRPTGWMAAGRLGVRREKIDGVDVIVAGPMNQGVRRLDLLAMLNWNLPELHGVIPDMPQRLLVVSAGDPMWRGGLSGPSSLFFHADRPLVSENGTSTLVHELMHVANRIEAEPGADWIVEGIAEYYSLKLMWRSGTITYHRFLQGLENLKDWSRQAERLDVDFSSGPVTARAVGVMRRLDREIHAKSDRKKSLDDVVRRLTASGQKVNLKRFRQTVVDVMGGQAEALSDERLGLDDGQRP